MSIPLVSVICTAYNHEPYIRQCLDGFVMQKTNFKFEAIVHDDASTDRTAAIIREYAEKYPDIIKPIYETENQYSKHDGSLDQIMRSHMQGKFVALCEGDDYWTDPLKLQKQVDFLEGHENISTCFCQFYRLENGKYTLPNKNIIQKYMNNSKYSNGFEFTLENLFDDWFIGTLTIMFRKDIKLHYEKYNHFCDAIMFYYCLKNNNGFFLTDNMAVYNRDACGVWSGLSAKKKLKSNVILYKELYTNEPSTFTRNLYNKVVKQKRAYNLRYINPKFILISLLNKLHHNERHI